MVFAMVTDICMARINSVLLYVWCFQNQHCDPNHEFRIFCLELYVNVRVICMWTYMDTLGTFVCCSEFLDNGPDRPIHVSNYNNCN